MKTFRMGMLGILFLCSLSVADNKTYNDSNPSISPNGQRVAFHSDRSGKSEIYLYDFDNGKTRQLTEMTVNAYGPSWSPDGGQVYFYAGKDSRMEVYRVSLDPSAQAEQVTKLGGYVSNPVISPDGTEMLVSWNEGIATGNDYEVFVYNLETGAMTQLTNNTFRDYTAVWSPDGKMIAFTSDREGEQFDVYVMDASGANQKKIADLNPHDYYTEWSPDGKWIAFFSGSDFDHFDAYQVHLDTGEIQQLTRGMGTGKLSFCPDGTCIVFGADTEDGGRLFWARPDGSGARRLDGSR